MATHSRKEPADSNLLLRIEVAMRRKEMRPTDLAAALGISDGAVSHWFNDRYEPGKERLPELARVLSVSIDWLMGKRLSAQDRDLERYILELLQEGGTPLLRALEVLPTHEVVELIEKAAARELQDTN